MDLSALVQLTALGGVVCGGVVWGIRLEGRVNTQEATTTLKIKHLREILGRLESKLDRLIEGR